MHRQQVKKRGVFLLVLIGAGSSLIWLFSALNSPDLQVQQLALRLVSLLGVGAILVMGIASLTRLEVPHPEQSRRK